MLCNVYMLADDVVRWTLLCDTPGCDTRLDGMDRIKPDDGPIPDVRPAAWTVSDGYWPNQTHHCHLHPNPNSLTGSTA